MYTIFARTRVFLIEHWVSEYLLFNAKWAICQLYHGENKLHWGDYGHVCFVLDQNVQLHFFNACSLKQQPLGRHVAPLEPITLILSKHVFALTLSCWIIRGKAASTNSNVFIWPDQGLKLQSTASKAC